MQERIMHRKRGITADTALRLARYFKTTAKFWLNLQTSYDLARASESSLSEIERSVQPREAA
jgi:addiction module HigA family antidote